LRKESKLPLNTLLKLKGLLCDFGRHTYFWIYPVGRKPRSIYHRINPLR